MTYLQSTSFKSFGVMLVNLPMTMLWIDSISFYAKEWARTDLRLFIDLSRELTRVKGRLEMDPAVAFSAVLPSSAF
jgi:hypothetical protein